MKNEGSSHGLYIVAIVGIVAVVGILVMVMNDARMSAQEDASGDVKAKLVPIKTETVTTDTQTVTDTTGQVIQAYEYNDEYRVKGSNGVIQK